MASERQKAELEREQRRAMRRLNAELGIGQGHGVRGLLLGALVIAVLFALVFAVAGTTRSATKVQGVVEGFSLRPSEYGDYPAARIWVDNRHAAVAIPRAARCHVGDRIDLFRSRRLAGYAYRLGPLGCYRTR